MKAVALCVLLMACAAAAMDVAFDTGADMRFASTSMQQVANPGGCFPQCQWQCESPQCPAACEPQCEKPACELRCEKLGETACDIRCEKPRCEVRCSRKNCQSGGCPLCENVCLPAKCQTVCTPAVPNCRPTCSAPKCTWSCRKPPSCPKPKCSLNCGNKAACASMDSMAALEVDASTVTKLASNSRQCCSCHNFDNLAKAVEMASSSHIQKHGAVPATELMPEMVDIAHEMRFSDKNQEQCCPCA